MFGNWRSVYVRIARYEHCGVGDPAAHALRGEADLQNSFRFDRCSHPAPLCRSAALDVPFPDARIRVLDELDLFGVELDGLIRKGLLQRHLPPIAAIQPVFDQNLLDGDV